MKASTPERLALLEAEIMAAKEKLQRSLLASSTDT
jgi:hypothetical protein